MRFTRLRLRNFKCFESIDTELSDGATVIHGVNGSGKSSLLEACFFALYGAASLPNGSNLESIVTKGTTETEIELWFAHNDSQYHLERKIRLGDSQPVHEAALRTPGQVIENITGVEAEIERVLRMDAEAFLNCAYIRQGDITRLLSASPDQRQRMIDDLLQLGKLETYRERMDRARVGVDRVRRDRASKLDDVEDEIAKLNDRSLREKRETIKAQIESRQSTLEDRNDSIEETRGVLTELESDLEEIEEQRQELDEIAEELRERREQLSETEQRVVALESDIDGLNTSQESLIGSIRVALNESLITYAGDISIEQIGQVETALADHLDELQEEHDRLHETIEKTRHKAQEAAATTTQTREQAVAKRDQAADHENRAERLREEAADKQSECVDLEDEVDEKRAVIREKKQRFEADGVPEAITFGDATEYRGSVEEELADSRERKEKIQSSLTVIEQRIDHAETLIEEGKCPECGQSVDGAPEVETIDADREKAASLRSKLSAVNDEVDERETELKRARELVEIESTVTQLEAECDSVANRLSDHRERIEELVGSAVDFYTEARENHQAAIRLEEAANEHEAERDEYLETADEYRGEKSDLEDRIASVREIQEMVDELDRVIERIEGVESQLVDVRTLKSEQETAVNALAESKAALEGSLDDGRITSLEAEYESVSTELEELKAERDELEAEVNELTEKRGAVQEEINRLESISDRAETLRDKVDALESVVDECAAIQELYSSLRTELRQQNVRQLEVLLNEIFDLVYQNDSYARIDLSEEYELAVFEKSGEVLDPSELSGGEKALFNLSLRCAIYQLLAEGISGQTPLPPLILDEPTVHLDSEHVNRISELVDRMRQLGVEQTIVVSHEAGIVDGANERIEVIQNPSTNRSTVNVESTDLLAGLT